MCLLWNLLASKLLFALYKLYSWFAHLKELIWLCEWPSFGLGVGIIWLQVQAQVCRLLSYKETVLLLRRVFRQIASDPTTLAHDTGNYWTFLSCWRDVFDRHFHRVRPCRDVSRLVILQPVLIKACQRERRDHFGCRMKRVLISRGHFPGEAASFFD